MGRPEIAKKEQLMEEHSASIDTLGGGIRLE
jgi:hypothetical protein